jgi:hypothetical protein
MHAWLASCTSAPANGHAQSALRRTAGRSLLEDSIMKFRNIVVAGFVALAPLSVGCAIDAGTGTEAEGPLGSVEMKLQTSTPAGVVYRLRNAVFTVTDATNTVVATLNSETAPADATRLSAAIDVGTYTVSLANGWSMERNGQVVQAALSSAAARSFVIQPDAATLVSYAFKVEGEAVVLGGTLDVAIEVGECSRDSFEPNDTRETAAALTSVLTAASVCGEDDWFTFELNAETGTPLAVTLDFVNANGDLDLLLVQPDMTELRSEGVTDQERIDFSSQNGAYFLRVYGFNGAVGNYRLAIIDQSGAG